MLTPPVIANAVLSLILVICLILITAQLLRWWQSERTKIGKSSFSSSSIPHQLEVVESRAIDFRRKLILVRRGDRLHLLLCSDGRDIVIETGIPYQPPHEPAHENKSDNANG